MKNAYEIRSKILVVSVNRGNNGTKRATRLVNFGKTVEDTRRRTRWKYLLKGIISNDPIFSEFTKIRQQAVLSGLCRVLCKFLELLFHQISTVSFY